jgi:preprotein translocase subunit Sec63
MKVNYYEILGVDRSASEQEIRDRFRGLPAKSSDRYRGPTKPVPNGRSRP